MELFTAQKLNKIGDLRSYKDLSTPIKISLALRAKLLFLDTRNKPQPLERNIPCRYNEA